MLCSLTYWLHTSLSTGEGEVFLYVSQEKFLMNVSEKEDVSEEIQ